MNQTNSPSGAAVSSAADISSEMSQWLYLHTSLGKGYIAPFPYDPTWVITAGVPAALTSRMRDAENDFHTRHEASLAKDKAKLEGLEHTAQASKRTGVNPALSAEIKELKERLARPVFVNYRDWSADKSTLLELLSKSKFRAMSFVDEMGIRAHNLTVNKFLAARHISGDLGLLSLTGDKGHDSVLIRSSATGGANMMTVRGTDTPRFNMMSLTSPQAVAKIATRLKEAAPARGVTVVLPDGCGKCLPVPADQIARVIAKVYATEVADNRITVTMSDAWVRFLNIDPSEVSTKDLALTAMAKALTSTTTLSRSITRALITRKVYLTEGDIEGAECGDRSLHLDDSDLTTALQWFDALGPALLGLKHLESRAANAEKAREARAADAVTPDELMGFKAQLVQLIKGDESGMVTMREAERAPGLTPRLIESLLSYFPDTFKTLADVRKPGSKRSSKRVIALAAGAGKAVGGEGDTWIPGANLDDQTVDKLYREWQAEAYQRFKDGKTPSINIAALAPALMPAAIAVQRRFWQSTTLVPSGKPTPLDKSGQPSLELWFRYRPDGTAMCAWSESFLEWRLAYKWAEKDEAAAEMRDGGPALSMSSREVSDDA